MTRYLSIFLGVVIVAYPFAVYWGVHSLGVGSVALLLACLFLLRALVPASFQGFDKIAATTRLLAFIGLILAVLSWLMHDVQWFKYYPVAVNALFFCIFFVSLFHPPTIIERFARIKDPDLPAEGVIYTKVVTQVWCVFFLLNGLVSFYTAAVADFKYWTIYNGFVSYLLIGTLFVGEFCFRHFYRKRL